MCFIAHAIFCFILNTQIIWKLFMIKKGKITTHNLTTVLWGYLTSLLYFAFLFVLFVLEAILSTLCFWSLFLCFFIRRWDTWKWFWGVRIEEPWKFGAILVQGNLVQDLSWLSTKGDSIACYRLLNSKPCKSV